MLFARLRLIWRAVWREMADLYFFGMLVSNFVFQGMACLPLVFMFRVISALR